MNVRWETQGNRKTTVLSWNESTWSCIRDHNENLRSWYLRSIETKIILDVSRRTAIDRSQSATPNEIAFYVRRSRETTMLKRIGLTMSRLYFNDARKAWETSQVKYESHRETVLWSNYCHTAVYFVAIGAIRVREPPTVRCITKPRGHVE